MIRNNFIWGICLFCFGLIVTTTLAGIADAQNTTESNPQPFFLEAFNDHSTFSKQWEQNTNGGTLLFAKGSVSLKGGVGGYPVIKTRQNPFPTSGDWTASFGFRYTRIGKYDTGLNCHGPNGKIVDHIHQDVNGQLVQIDNESLSFLRPDTDWHIVSFATTNSKVTAYLDGKMIGESIISNRPTNITIGDGGSLPNPLDWSDLQVALVRVDVGRHILDKTALNFGDQPTGTVTEASFAVSHDADVVAVQDNDSAVCCILGDTIHLSGTTSGQHRLKRRSLSIDGQPYDDNEANPNNDGYSYDWKPNTLGNHHLAVNFTLQNPYEFLGIKNVSVKVLPKAPLALEQFSKPIPSSIPVMVRSLDTTVFHPVRVEFFLNGQSVGTANQAPFQVILPISKQLPGSYAVSYQAYDAEGVRLSGESETITVPLRVKLTMPSSVTLAQPKQITPFAADIVPDLKIVRVTYSVGDQQVATSVTPPYEAKVDLSSFKSGTYPIKAEVSIEDGETFCNPPSTINLTNQPDDERLARLAKEDADLQAKLLKQEEAKQAQLAKQIADAAAVKAEQERVAKEMDTNLAAFWPRPGFDEKTFRKQAAALAFYVPEKRHGEIGKVHGLSVFTINDVPQFGAPLTVSATVRPGTGQTNFLAFSEEDSKIAAQQAAEYCKTKTASFHWDWSKYDLSVGYLENDLKNGGPSAGAADALAMMSAILATPVDSSVAITGALTLQGQVEPVGGIGLKVEAAFANTNVHTVIVPAGAISEEYLTQLYISEPGLCFNRRVILARDMDDVMNQSLIGWNTDSEVREEHLVQGGLQHFAQGQYKAALAAFTAAKQITPENWTINFWTNMVYAVENQH